MPLARREIGTKEVPGAEDHPRILQYLRTCRLIPALQHDETPWCAAFVGFVLETSDIGGTKSAAARSYLHWGEQLESPRKGCVAVLTREGHPGSGHVGFYVGEVGDKIMLLGGNQHNKVCVQMYPKDRVISYRWPVL